MPGSDRYSLIVESATRGEAELRRLTDSLNRISDAAVKAGQRSAGLGPSYSRASKDLESANRAFASSVRGFVESPLQAAGGAAENFALRFGKVGSVAAGVGVGVALAGREIFSFVGEVGDAAEKIQNLSDRTGLSVSQVDRFQASARIAGVSVESLAAGGKTLAAVLQSTSREGQQARASMRDLGVSFFDSRGGARDLGDVLGDLLPALQGIESRTAQVDLATKTLGRGAVELLPLIRNFKELDKTAKELGFGGRDKLLADLAAAGDEVDKLGLRWDILKAKFARPLSAVVNVTSGALDVLAGSGPAIRLGSSARLSAGEFGGVAQPTRPEPFVGPTETEGDTRERAERLRREAASRQEAADRFSAQFAQTEAGRRNRLSDIGEQRTQIVAALQAPELDASARAERETRLRLLNAEERAIEAAIRAQNEAVSVAQSIRAFAFKAAESGASELERSVGRIASEADELSRRAPAAQRPLIATAARIQTDAEISAASSRRFEAISRGRQTLGEQESEVAARDLEAGRLQRPAGDIFFAAGPARPVDIPAAIDVSRARAAGELAREARLRKESLDLLIESVEFEARRIELLAGPGSEAAALQRTTELRLEAVDLAKQLGAELNSQAEKTRILQDAELRRLDIAKQQRATFQEGVGRTFDAAIPGGVGGLRALAQSQLTGLGRQLAVNLSGEIFRGAAGRIALPGQRKQDGSPTLIGRLFSGTPLADTGALRGATDLNTTATLDNTRALLRASTVAAQPSGESVSGIAAALRAGQESTTVVAPQVDVAAPPAPNVSVSAPVVNVRPAVPPLATPSVPVREVPALPGQIVSERNTVTRESVRVQPVNLTATTPAPVIVSRSEAAPLPQAPPDVNVTVPTTAAPIAQSSIDLSGFAAAITGNTAALDRVAVSLQQKTSPTPTATVLRESSTVTRETVLAQPAGVTPAAAAPAPSITVQGAAPLVAPAPAVSVSPSPAPVVSVTGPPSQGIETGQLSSAISGNTSALAEATAAIRALQIGPPSVTPDVNAAAPATVIQAPAAEPRQPSARPVAAAIRAPISAIAQQASRPVAAAASLLDAGLKLATELNTSSHQQNTAAVQSSTLAMTKLAAAQATASTASAARSVADGATSTIPSLLGSAPVGQSADPRRIQVPRAVAEATPVLPGAANPFLPTKADGVSFSTQFGSKAVTGAAYGAAAAGAAFGIRAGVKEGGTRGALTAISSGLGAAAVISPEPISKAILAAAAAATGIAAGLLQSPKIKREKEIDSLASGARVDPSVFEPLSFDSTFNGRAFDTNIRGDIREFTPQPQPIQITVQTLDARSFADNAEMISDAVIVAMDGGHRLNRRVQEAVLYQ